MKGAAVVKAINEQAASIVQAINNIELSTEAATPYDDAELIVRLESINDHIDLIGSRLFDLTAELKRGNDMREERELAREKRRKMKFTEY